MNKKGNLGAGATIVVAGLILVLVLGLVGVIDLPFLDKIGSVAGDKGAANSCTGGETQAFTLKGVDEETGAANTDNFSYRKDGETAWTEGTLGTAITTMETGADYEYVVGPSPTSEQGDSYGQYGIVKNLPCTLIKETDVMADTLYTDMSATFYNNDNNAAAVDLDGSATPKWVHIKWAAAGDEVAGNPYLKDAPIQDNSNHRKEYPNIACTNVNSSLIADVEAWHGGVEMNRVGSPVNHAAGASLSTYCFEAPVFTENEALYDMKFDPDDTNYAGLDTDRTLSLYSGSFFFHSKTADLSWGVETDDNNFVQFTAAETVTLDFT